MRVLSWGFAPVRAERVDELFTDERQRILDLRAEDELFRAAGAG